MNAVVKYLFGGMLSDMNIKPHQSPLFDSPENYELPFENVSFTASDGVTLRGWLIRGSTSKVVIQSHFGVQCNRAGFDPTGKPMAKLLRGTPIKFLEHAKFLHSKGYSILMYDFRNHGSSDLGSTPWVTWGPEEGKDVVAAVDFIKSKDEYR